MWFLTRACPLLLFQVDASTPCQCPTPTARAPVKPASPSHWSCPRKAPSPMGPTLPPPWKKAPPLLGKLSFTPGSLLLLMFGLGKLNFYSLALFILLCMLKNCFIFAFCRLILTPLSHCWALFWLLSSLPGLEFYFRSVLDEQDFQLPRPSLVLFILGEPDFHSAASRRCYAYLCVSVVFTSPSFTAGCLSITPGSLKLTGKGKLIEYSWENMLLFNFPISKQRHVIYCNLTM